MSSFNAQHHHQGKDQHKIPETVTGEEGTAKRNIVRRHGGTGSGSAGGSRKEGLAGSKSLIDDGSTYEDPNALDEHDPNYDSEEERRPQIPTYAALHREEIAKSHLTLTSYKKLVQPIIDEFFEAGDLAEVARCIQVYFFTIHPLNPVQ